MSVLPPNFQLPLCIQTLDEGSFYDAKINPNFTLLNSKVQQIGQIAFCKVIFGPAFSLDNTTLKKLGNTAFSNAKFDDSFTLENTIIEEIELGCFAKAKIGNKFALPKSLSKLGAFSFMDVVIKNPNFIFDTKIKELENLSLAKTTLPTRFVLPKNISVIKQSTFSNAIFDGEFTFNYNNVFIEEFAFSDAIFNERLFFAELSNFTFTNASFMGIKVNNNIHFNNCKNITISSSSFANSAARTIFSHNSTFSEIQSYSFYGFKFEFDRVWCGIKKVHSDAFAMSSFFDYGKPDFIDLGFGIYKNGLDIINEWTEYKHLSKNDLKTLLQKRSTKIFTSDLYFEYIKSHSEYKNFSFFNDMNPLHACFMASNECKINEFHFTRSYEDKILKYDIPTNYKLPFCIKYVPKFAFSTVNINGLVIEEGTVFERGAFNASTLYGDINITNSTLTPGFFSGTTVDCNLIWPNKFKTFAKIPSDFFADSEIKSNIHFPNISYFADNVFSYAEVYGNISFEGDNLKFASWSFSDGRYYGNIHLPQKLKKIYANMFSGSKIYGILFIPSTINEVSFMAFSDAEIKNNISFSNSLFKICSYSFQNTKLPKDFKLPNSVEVIEDYAFEGCTIGGHAIQIDTDLGGG